jgi:hypothetical protein
MIKESTALVPPGADLRWEKVLDRFALIETQLQELYWEMVDCIDDETALPRHEG